MARGVVSRFITDVFECTSAHVMALGVGSGFMSCMYQ